jgi:hypothetical protein
MFAKRSLLEKRLPILLRYISIFAQINFNLFANFEVFCSNLVDNLIEGKEIS